MKSHSESPTIYEKYDLMSHYQVAEVFDVTPQTIHNWARKNQLPDPVKIGKRIWFKRNEIEDFMKDLVTKRTIPIANSEKTDD
tara:strand:+ start:248 stop:496 length:249 start_codon:yes stop_codon:yes gene_type:complete